MLKFFDLETIGKKPLIWEDIWIYIPHSIVKCKNEGGISSAILEF